MRNLVSVLLTVVGLAAFYLFACGALATATDGWSWQMLLEKSATPFLLADAFSLLVLGLGTGCFAMGAVLAPRTAVWVAPSNPSLKGEAKKVRQYHVELSSERLLELGLVINVVIVASILFLLGCFVLRETPVPRSVLGALFSIAAIQVLLGVVVTILLYRRKATWARRRRPVFMCSAGLNLTEGCLLLAVVLLGYL